MQLGYFPVSLTVNDLAVSRQFYERLASVRSPLTPASTG
jgi:hypothetical protein